MSMNINYPLEIDVNRGGLSTTVAVQGDHIGRKINVTFVSAGQIVDLTGCSAMVKCSYNNKTIAVNSCEIKTNIVIVTLTKTMLAYSGKLELQVTVTGSGGEIISTPIIYVLVSKSISTEPVEQVEDFSILADLTERIMKTLSDPAVGSAEVKDARGAYTLLGDRLDAMDDTYINFLDAPNHAKTFTQSKNWNLYYDIKLATREDHVTLSGVAEGSSQCGLLNLDKTLHCDADGYSTVLVKIRMRAVDCSVTVNIRDDGWFNNQCIIDSNVENWERASTYLAKELTKNEWVTAWVVVGGAERDITKVGLQAVSPATAFKIEIASIDVYYSQDSLSGDVQKANSDISQLQSNDRQLDSKITALQTDNTQNKQNITKLQTDNTQNKSNISDLATSVATNILDITKAKSDITNLDTKITKNASNIAELQTESDALQKIQFSVFGVDDSGWENTHGASAWRFKPNSMYIMPASSGNNVVIDLPSDAYIIGWPKIIITLGKDSNSNSPTYFTDTYKTEKYDANSHTEAGTFPRGGTTQILITERRVWRRTKYGDVNGYGSWMAWGMDFRGIATASDFPNNLLSDIGHNCITRINNANLVTDTPNNDKHGVTIETISPYFTESTEKQSIYNVQKAYYCKSDPSAYDSIFVRIGRPADGVYTQWDPYILGSNLNMHLKTSEYIKSLEARIAALEKQ